MKAKLIIITPPFFEQNNTELAFIIQKCNRVSKFQLNSLPSIGHTLIINNYSFIVTNVNHVYDTGIEHTSYTDVDFIEYQIELKVK